VVETVKRQLERWFAGAEKVVVAGVGNPIRHDDFVGLKVVEELAGKLPENVLLLECETVPESRLLEIEEFHPTHVLIIDAAFLGHKPGKTSLVGASKLAQASGVSTHLLPLKVFCDYVEQAVGAKVALLLFEPESLDFGEGLSAPVEAAALRVAKVLVELLG
jgi:hydrogenase 3 maturation protease